MKTEQLYNLFRESAGISTDSRTVKKDQIFFALWGDNYNGNEFAAEAVSKGACCAVIDDPAFETDRTLLVDDCLFELQALAEFYRKELNVPVIAITGTNGKTTTKELISSILSKKFRVHSTKGNLNNHIGVPVTLLSAPSDTEMMVIEMGANHPGEIRTLCLIARPDYGLITNTGMAHIQGFGSLEGVIRTKTELYEFLKKTNGLVLYNDDDPVLAEKVYKLVVRAVPFSAPTGTELIIESLPSEMLLEIAITFRKRKYNIRTGLFGKHNLENIRSAVATGLFFNVAMEDICDALENYAPANNRSQVKVTSANTLICDAYNANPESMVRSIDSFSGLQQSKKLAILGDMLELGEETEAQHKKILDLLREKQIVNVLLAGPVFKKLAGDYGLKAYENVDGLIEHLQHEPVRGYHILIKGSRAMMLEKVYGYL
jgi:UDP-N-acetylmuramoyl-tripeptide--D-alanyl-D-alanine ligase